MQVSPQLNAFQAQVQNSTIRQPQNAQDTNTYGVFAQKLGQLAKSGGPQTVSDKEVIPSNQAEAKQKKPGRFDGEAPQFQRRGQLVDIEA